MAQGNGASTSHISREKLDHIAATHATVERSAIRNLEADQVQLEKSAVNRLRAEQATFEHSSVAVASFDQGTVRQSSAGIILGRSVACDEVRTVFLASPVVRGDVHTWLDLRTAVALGFGMVLGRALLGGMKALIRR